MRESIQPLPKPRKHWHLGRAVTRTALEQKPEAVFLPSEFRDLDTNYKQDIVYAYSAVLNGLAKAERGLPLELNLKDYTSEIIALAPKYDLFKQLNLQPQLIFVPEGLQNEDWDMLFSSLQKGWIKTTGFRCDQALQPDTQNGINWSVAVISATKTPVADVAVTKEHMDYSYCPTINQYCALQWTRLAQRQSPLDIYGSNASLVKGNSDELMLACYDSVSRCITCSYPDEMLSATWGSIGIRTIATVK